MSSLRRDKARALAVAEWACRVQPQVEALVCSLGYLPAGAPLADRAHEALLSLHPSKARAAPTPVLVPASQHCNAHVLGL